MNINKYILKAVSAMILIGSIVLGNTIEVKATEIRNYESGYVKLNDEKVDKFHDEQTGLWEDCYEKILIAIENNYGNNEFKVTECKGIIEDVNNITSIVFKYSNDKNNSSNFKEAFKNAVESFIIINIDDNNSKEEVFNKSVENMSLALRRDNRAMAFNKSKRIINNYFDNIKNNYSPEDGAKTLSDYMFTSVVNNHLNKF